jgi:multiple sugar transport system substrate-binding protein
VSTAQPYRLARPLALLALLTVQAGCSKVAPDNPAVAKAAPPITLTALVWAPDWPDEMHRIAAEFNRTHPQIQVEVQFMIGNSVEENLKPKVASNKLPDLLSVNPNAYAADLADQGLLADLSQTPVWANMLDSLKTDWTSRQNKPYGISGGVAATLIYYNQSQFEQAGITSLPSNFDEFLAVCEQLKRAGFTPIMWNGGFPNMLGNGPFSFGFANNVVARQPDWKRQISDGSLDLNTPQAADIFAKIKLVAQRGYVQKGYQSTNYDEGIKLFTEGKTAMAFHGTWAAGRLMNGQDFKTGIFMPPWNAPGKTAVPVIGSETGFAVGETPHKQAALQFLDYLYGPGFEIYQNKRQNMVPLKRVQGRVLADPLLTQYIAAAAAYPVTASPYYSFLPASTIEMLHPLLQEVLAGQVTPQQAAQKLDASIKTEARQRNK